MIMPPRGRGSNGRSARISPRPNEGSGFFPEIVVILPANAFVAGGGNGAGATASFVEPRGILRMRMRMTFWRIRKFLGTQFAG
jgi:hypothetical protein